MTLVKNMLELNKIYCGDCLEVMKDIDSGSVDMVLTDPPYGMNFVSNYRGEKHSKIKNDDNTDWLPGFSKELFRVCKDGTAHYIFCSFHNIDVFKIELQKHFKIKNLLVWEKNNTSMGDLNGDFAPKVEFIWFIQKGIKKINGSRDPNIFKFNKTHNNYHPTQKPVSMFEYLISKFSEKNDLIFDPFIGSGTTAVAAAQTYRNFIGIEKDPKYVKIAIQRITQAEPQLF